MAGKLQFSPGRVFTFNAAPRGEHKDLLPPRQQALADARVILEGHENALAALDPLQEIHPLDKAIFATLVKHMKNRIEDEDIDRIATAHIAMISGNSAAALGLLDKRGERIVRDFSKWKKGDSDSKILKAISGFSEDSKILVLCTSIAGMRRDVRREPHNPGAHVTQGEVRKVAHYLQKLGHIGGMDGRLVSHMMQAFNDLSLQARAPEALIRNNDNKPQIVMKQPVRVRTPR